MTINPSMLGASGSSGEEVEACAEADGALLGSWKKSGGAFWFSVGGRVVPAPESAGRRRKGRGLRSPTTHIPVTKGWKQKDLYNLRLILHLRR